MKTTAVVFIYLPGVTYCRNNPPQSTAHRETNVVNNIVEVLFCKNDMQKGHHEQ